MKLKEYKIPERDILKSIRQYLSLRGVFCIRMQQGLGSFKGLPDLLCIKNGIVFFIEVKKKGGKLSSHQQKFKEMWESFGGHMIVAYSVDDVMKIV